MKPFALFVAFVLVSLTASGSEVIRIRYFFVSDLRASDVTIKSDDYLNSPSFYSEQRTPLTEAITRLFEQSSKCDRFQWMKPLLTKMDVTDDVLNLHIAIEGTDIFVQEALRLCVKNTLEEIVPYSKRTNLHVPSLKGFRFVFTTGSIWYFPQKGHFAITTSKIQTE